MSEAQRHLEDAAWHLRRTLDDIREAARDNPDLLLPLGSLHARLADELAELQRVEVKR